MLEQKKIDKKDQFKFKLLPAFADYILKNKLREFTKEQLKLTFEVDLPVLKYYDLSMYSEEQLIELSIPTYREFFNAAKENKLKEHLADAIKKWETNQLPNITRDQLVVEDITLATYIRKKALLAFIHDYTTDVNIAIELVKEIDDYTLQAESQTFHTYINIHNEKLNEINKALKEHEAGFLEAQEIAGFGSFEWNLTGGISTYTPQVFKIFEIDQISSLTDFLEYVHPGDREKLQEALDKAMKGEADYECEYRYRKNGKEKILWSRGVVSFKDNKPLVLKGTVMDITDRHYILQRLERNEELYKQAQKLTHIGNWTWDLATGQIKYSDELLRIYGLKPNEEMTFEKSIKLVHPEDVEKVNDSLNYSIETHKPHSLDFRIIRADGAERIIRRNAEVLVDEKGKPYKLAGTGQDITKEVLLNKEIKDRELQLAELNASLEQKNIALENSNKELTSFSYIASHDLQEPLRKIKTFSNLILEKEKNLSPDGKDCFERIMISAERMQKLIEDLLAFSRTQIFEKKFEPVDLNHILEEVKLLYSEAISEGRVEINFKKLPVINAVSFQIQQLFENIVSNSVKYHIPGKKTEITITSKLVSSEEMPFFHLAKPINYYKISIADNGIGFDQKYSEKIFEIFQRLHGKNEYGGTGIGLSICKKIVENHNGFIEAIGKINKGATFIIYFPA